MSQAYELQPQEPELDELLRMNAPTPSGNDVLTLDHVNAIVAEMKREALPSQFEADLATLKAMTNEQIALAYRGSIDPALRQLIANEAIKRFGGFTPIF